MVVFEVEVVQGRGLQREDLLMKVLSSGDSPEVPSAYVIAKYDEKTVHKTDTRKYSATPVWKNESFLLQLAEKNQGNILWLEVWDARKIQSDEFLGVVPIPVSTLPAEGLHEWLPLQSRPLHRKICCGELLVRVKEKVFMKIADGGSSQPTLGEKGVGGMSSIKGMAKGSSSGGMSEVLSSRMTAKQYIAANVWESLSSSERKKQETLYEVISTEITYVRDLDLLVNNLSVPMRKANLLKEMRELYSLLATLSSLLSINQSFLGDLKERQTVMLPSSIKRRLSDNSSSAPSPLIESSGNGVVEEEEEEKASLGKKPKGKKTRTMNRTTSDQKKSSDYSPRSTQFENVGDIFLAHVDMFKMYGAYCSRYVHCALSLASQRQDGKV